MYTRYDRAAPVVNAAKKKLDAALVAQLATAETLAADAFAAGDSDAALAALDAHAVAAGALASRMWRELWTALTVAFIDGRVTVADEDDAVCGCAKNSIEFSDAWKTKVKGEGGE